MSDLDAANKLWMGDVRTCLWNTGQFCISYHFVVGVLYGRGIFDVCLCTVRFSCAIHTLDQKLPDRVIFFSSEASVDCVVTALFFAVWLLAIVLWSFLMTYLHARRWRVSVASLFLALVEYGI